MVRYQRNWFPLEDIKDGPELALKTGRSILRRGDFVTTCLQSLHGLNLIMPWTSGVQELSKTHLAQVHRHGTVAACM